MSSRVRLGSILLSVIAALCGGYAWLHRAARPTEPSPTAREGTRESAGLAPLESTSVPATPVLEARARMVAGGTTEAARPARPALTGRVVDSETGSPIRAGAISISLEGVARPIGTVTVPIGVDGRFQAELADDFPLPPNVEGVRLRYEVRCEHYRGAVVIHPIASIGDLAIERTIACDRLITVTGTITSVARKALSGVEVRVCGGGELAQAWTDATGSFHLEIGTPEQLLATHPRYGSARILPLPVPASRARGLSLPTVALRERGSIGGQAVLADGRPAPRVPVSAVLLPAGGPLSASGASHDVPGPCSTRRGPNPQVLTDDDGRFHFADLEDGEYALRSPTDLTPAGVVEARVRLGEASARVVVPIRILAVHLVDDARRPVPQVQYTYEFTPEGGGPTGSGAGDADAVTGRVDVRIPTSGVVLFTAKAGALEAFHVELRVTAADWTMDRTLVMAKARPQGRIDVHVVDPSGKRVLPFYAFIRLDGSSPTDFASQAVVMSGSGTLSGALAPGEYVVDVLPGSFGPIGQGPDAESLAACRTRVQVVAGVDTIANVVAVPGGRVSVTLRTTAAAPSRSITWAIRSGDSEIRWPGAWSSPDPERFGGVAFGSARQRYTTPLPPGRYVLSVQADGLADVAKEFDVRRGETIDLDVEMRTK